MCWRSQDAALIVGHSLANEKKIVWERLRKSRVIDPPMLLLVVVAQTFFLKLATSCQTLDKLVSRKALPTWSTYFGF